MAPKIELAPAAPDKVRADLLAVPVFTGPQLGPGADVVDRALGGTLLGFVAEVGFEGKRGETLSVPTGGQLGAKAAVLVGMGEPDQIDADALRRAGAALARRSAKVAKVATTLLDAAPDSLDRADAAQAFAEGVALGRLPVPHVQVGREAHEAHARRRCWARRTRRCGTALRGAPASRRRSCGPAIS